MKNLLYKEFKLVLHPAILITLLLEVLLFIPAYPYFIVFWYPLATIFIIFKTLRENKDVFFTACLPARKKDMVKARVYSVVTIELMQTVVAVPVAIISSMINQHGNTLGMDANMAFFGFVLIMYAIFNGVFLPMFYKTAYKIGMPFFLAFAAVTIYSIGLEFAVQLIPFLKTNLDTMGSSHLISHLLVLIGGIGIFALTTALVNKKAAKNFEKIDL